ncbi:MAG: Rrf2 family transcriptional regulator [Actinomycetota bacterium]|nr:Rrf2 family transcriptional regulator [Actinomycetota bacterium]
MQISAKADYAVRALIELAAAGDGPVKGEWMAVAQQLPPKFLESILAQLCHHGLLHSRRGAEGGYWLGRPAEQITLAQIIRATDGPLASVRGQPPEDTVYERPAQALTEVWIAVRASLRVVLEAVTIADLVRGQLPEAVARLADDPDARRSHI